MWWRLRLCRLWRVLVKVVKVDARCVKMEVETVQDVESYEEEKEEEMMTMMMMR